MPNAIKVESTKIQEKIVVSDIYGNICGGNRPVMSLLGEWRQEDQGLMIILGYISSSVTV